MSWNKASKIIGNKVKEGELKKNRFKKNALDEHGKKLDKPKQKESQKHERVKQGSRYFEPRGRQPGSKDYQLAKRISKHIGVPDGLIMAQYLTFNFVTLETLAFLTKSSVSHLRKKTEARYFGSELIEEPALTSIRVFRQFDENGDPVTKTGLEAVKVDTKFYQYMIELHKKKRII